MACVALPASTEVKTEPRTTEIDIKEEPLEATPTPPITKEPAPSAAVAAATRLLTHQLSGIKETLKASKTDPRPEDLHEEGEIDEDDESQEDQKHEVEGENDVAEGKAARMPVWQSLGEDEAFPLPHWIGVSGTSSDGLNNKTQEFIGRIRDVSPETAVAWEKEVKDTVVQIDEDGVRRISKELAARQKNWVDRRRAGGGYGKGCQLPSKRFGSRSPSRRRSRSRDRPMRRSRSRSPIRRSPPRRQRSR